VREGWIELSEARLHYVEWEPERDEVREPSLLLLHGLSSNALFWSRLARHLLDRRLVALDQYSHGRSDSLSDRDYGEVIEAASRAVVELGLKRPLVVGHSWGASVGLELTATRPALASGLVFVDGPPAAMSRVMSWEDASERMQPPFPVYGDLEQAVEAQRSYLGEVWDDDLRDFVRRGLAEVEGGLTSTLTFEARQQILRRIFEFDPPDFFPMVEGPVLLAMAARLWPGAPQEFEEGRRLAVELVMQRRPDVQVRWYDSRHDIPLIRPLELAADVERTAIAAAFASVAREAAELEGDWSRPVHGGSEAAGDEAGEPWRARDLLAHLSSTQAAMAQVVTTPPSEEADGERPRFDPDRWNASQVRRRRELSPADLVSEMRRGAVGLQAALMDVDLEQVVAAGSFAGLPVRDAMQRMVEHQRVHLEELRRTLAG
jgi:pimeloyl-ACP methyl ester carboxylesterase